MVISEQTPTLSCVFKLLYVTKNLGESRTCASSELKGYFDSFLMQELARTRSYYALPSALMSGVPCLALARLARADNLAQVNSESALLWRFTKLK